MQNCKVDVMFNVSTFINTEPIEQIAWRIEQNPKQSVEQV